MRTDGLDEIFEKGGYRSSIEMPAGFTFAKIKRAIAKAVSDKHKFRTAPQIKRFLNIDPRFDLSEILGELQYDGTITSESNAVVTAFFPGGTVPKRFWLTGLGTVDADLDKSSVKKPEQPEPDYGHDRVFA